MNPAQRAYNMLKGYVMREWERIQGLERDLAEEELRESLRDPARRPEPPVAEGGEVYERASDPVAVARRMLGVGPDEGFDSIRRAFDRLSKRSDPKNFPSGTEEQRQAEQIHKRVHWAYLTLTERFDVTEKRFKTLELE